jgi:hypothetical protein
VLPNLLRQYITSSQRPGFFRDSASCVQRKKKRVAEIGRTNSHTRVCAGMPSHTTSSYCPEHSSRQHNVSPSRCGCEVWERTLGTGRSTSSTLPWIRVILSSKPLSEIICLFSIPHETSVRVNAHAPRCYLQHNRNTLATMYHTVQCG